MGSRAAVRRARLILSRLVEATIWCYCFVRKLRASSSIYKRTGRCLLMMVEVVMRELRCGAVRAAV
jgi:hypothetical protein